MGTSILLKNADFSQSGFKTDVVLFDYLNLVGTGSYTMQTTFIYNSSLLYKGCVLMETAGKSLNKITLFIGANTYHQSLIVAKYNTSTHDITNIKTFGSTTFTAGQLNEFLLDEIVTLSENEVILLTSETEHSGPDISGVDGLSGSVYRWNYVQASGTMPNPTNFYPRAPKAKVELVY